MKKITSLLLTVALVFGLIGSALASVDTVSITSQKTSSSVTLYIKNDDDDESKKVKLETQKKVDGKFKTISSTTISVGSDKQVTKKYSLSDGTYRFKYSVGAKYDYTKEFKFN